MSMGFGADIHAAREGSLGDAISDILAAAGGDTLYHGIVSLFSGKSGKGEGKAGLGGSLKSFFEEIAKNNPRKGFVSRFLKLNSEQQATFDEIYHWWFAPAPEGADRKENTFVVLVMIVDDKDWDAFVEFITSKWKAGDEGHQAVNDMFYKLEHDVIDQYVEHDLVDPVLDPLEASLHRVNQHFDSRRAARRNRR